METSFSQLNPYFLVKTNRFARFSKANLDFSFSFLAIVIKNVYAAPNVWGIKHDEFTWR